MGYDSQGAVIALYCMGYDVWVMMVILNCCLSYKMWVIMGELEYVAVVMIPLLDNLL